MSEDRPEFPDYGDNGDTAGVRRARRSFRLVIVSTLLLTASMWITERFLQNNEAERTFIIALTHEHPSARVFLLEAIKADKRLREKPTPKYTQALAVRSENDVILDLEREGVELDPANAFFRMRYGCRLFIMNKPGEALVQFREASNLLQRNSLPLYLEAAAIAQQGRGSREALAEALTQVAIANSRDDGLVFPRPIWTEAYPQDGMWYAKLSREIYDEVCSPLYALSRHVAEDVSRQIDQGRLQNAQTWLSEMMNMGERLVLKSEPLATTQAIAGVSIQLEALEVLQKLGAPMNGMTDEAAIERELRLKQSLDTLQNFERQRDGRVTEQVRKFQQPMILVGIAFGTLVSVHLLGLAVHRVLRFKKSRWTVPHSRIGKGVLAFGSLAFFVLLWIITIIQHSEDTGYDAVKIVSLLWYILLGGMVAFGLLYPAATLKSVEEVSRRTGRLEDMEQTVRQARHAYRRAYASLSLRYYGILSGVVSCVICAWIILYRIVIGLYPWQFKLLASALLHDERNIVRHVITQLQ